MNALTLENKHNFFAVRLSTHDEAKAKLQPGEFFQVCSGQLDSLKVAEIARTSGCKVRLYCGELDGDVYRVLNRD